MGMEHGRREFERERQERWKTGERGHGAFGKSETRRGRKREKGMTRAFSSFFFFFVLKGSESGSQFVRNFAS